MGLNDNVSSDEIGELSMLNSSSTEGNENAVENNANLEGGEPTPSATPPPSDDLDTLFAEAEKTMPFGVETSDDIEQYEEQANDRMALNQSLEEGNVDLGLDQYKGMGTTEETRSRNQSNGVKGIKAIGGGILQGALIFAEQAGYVADIDSYTNMFSETEDFSGNSWTRLMKKTQEGLRESNAFKIYEDAPDPNSLTSNIFKWNSLEGAISSAVGFGLAGLAPAALVSRLGSMKMFSTMAKATDAVLGRSAAAAVGGQGLKAAKAYQKMQGATGAFMGPLASSMTSNYFMGQMMGADTFKASMDGLREKGMIGNGKGQISELEAQTIANDNAQDMVMLNMALTATAFLKFGNIFKPSKATGMIKNPAAMAQLKEMVIKGSPTSLAENVYQEMIQMEQIQDTQEQAGVAESEFDYSANFWDRAAQLALSTRALHAGALGVVGGPIQFATIQMPMMRGQKLQDRKNLYAEQESSRKIHKEMVTNNMKDFKDYEDAIDKAIISGKVTDADLVSDLQLAREMVLSAENGTIDYLRNDVEKIAEMTPEQAAKEGYDVNTYKEVAKKTLERMDEMEIELYKNAGKEGAGKIVYNRLVRNRVKEELKISNIQLSATLASILDDISIIPGLENIDLNKDLTIKRNKNRFEGFKEDEIRAIRKEETKQNEDLAKFLENNVDFDSYTEAVDSYVKASELVKELDKQYQYFKSKKGQAEFRKQQEKAVADQKEVAKDEIDKEEQNKAGNAASQFAKFSKIQNEAPIETAEQKTEREKEWKETTDENLEAVINPDKTFSSRDRKGETRLYTEGDLVRSKDGRTFVVEGQNYASSKKGDLEYETMPVLTEVNAKGRKIKGAKSFELGENAWLRPEVFQLGNNKYYRMDGSMKWSPYVKADSALRPNNLKYQEAKQEYAEEGLVKTANGFQHKQIKGVEQLENTSFGNEYNSNEFNLPFEGKSEVYFKLRKEGQGKNFIDVYRKSDTGKDVLLTRLDRNNNMNHDALAEALTRGEVKGEIIDHYSSKRNIVTKVDADGNKVYHSIGELAKMDKRYLPNGKVYIAQTNGKYAKIRKDAAISMDGDVVEDGVITVTRNGEEVQLEIPYDAMTAGDTHFLMLGPSGRLVPVAMSTKQIQDSSSTTGHDNLVGDVTDSLQSSIEDYFSEALEDWQDKIDAAISAIDSNNSIMAADKPAAIKDKLRKELGLTSKDDHAAFQEHLQNTAYTHVRPGKQYIWMNKNGSMVTVNEKGKPVINPDFFQLTVAIDSNYKVVPAVQVRSNYRPTSRKTLNITDVDASSEMNFVDQIGKRLRRISIDHMMDPQAYEEHTGTSFVDDIFNSSDLQTDINIEQPFSGSSATIQVIGDDVIVEGGKLAEAQRKRLGKKFTKKEQKVSKENIEDFSEIVDDILKFDEDAHHNLLYMESEDHNEVTTSVRNMVSSFPIKDSSKALKIVNDLMGADESKFEGDQLQAYDDAVELAKSKGVKEGVDSIAKAIMVLGELQTQINDGKISLKLTSSDSISDPAGLGVQKENIVFFKGTEVIHAVHGLVTISKSLKDGYYFVSKKTRAGVKNIKAYAKDVFTKNSDYAKASKSKQALEKLNRNPDVNKDLIKAEQRKLDIIENRIAKAEAKKAKSQEQSDSAEVTGGGDFSQYNLAEVYEEITGTSKYGDIIEEFGSTNRVNEITGSAVKFKNYNDKYYENLNEQATKESVKDSRQAMLDAIPYTDKQLVDLATLAEGVLESAEEGTVEHKDALKAVDDIAGLRKLRDSLESNLDNTDDIKVEGPGLGLRGKHGTLRLPALKVTASFGDSKGTESNAKIEDNLANASRGIDVALSVIVHESKLKSADFTSKGNPQISSPTTTGTVTKTKPTVTTTTEPKVTTTVEPQVKSKKKKPTTKKPTQKVVSDASKTINELFEMTNEEVQAFDKIVAILSKSKSGFDVQAYAQVYAKKKGFKPKKSTTHVPPKFDSTVMTEGEYEVFVDYGTAPKEVIQAIAQKIKDGKALTPPEVAVHGELTADIEKVLQELKKKDSSKTKGKSRAKVNTLPKRSYDKFQISGIVSEPLALAVAVKMEEADRLGIPYEDFLSEEEATVYNMDSAGKIAKYKDRAKEKVDAKENFVKVVKYVKNVLLDYELTDADGNKILDDERADLEESIADVFIPKNAKDPKLTIRSVLEEYLHQNNIKFEFTVFKLGGEVTMSQEAFDFEVAEAKKMLPKVPLEVVKDVTTMVNKYGVQAIGSFDKGVRYLVNRAKDGTAYHETFHAVAGLYLTMDEKQRIATENGEKAWSLKLEEKLADDFADYVQKKKTEGFSARVRRFFNNLMNWVKGSRSQDYTTQVFEKIASKGYAKTDAINTINNSISKHSLNTIEKFKSTLSEKEKVTLQELQDKGEIKIVC